MLSARSNNAAARSHSPSLANLSALSIRDMTAELLTSFGLRGGGSEGLADVGGRVISGCSAGGNGEVLPIGSGSSALGLSGGGSCCPGREGIWEQPLRTSMPTARVGNSIRRCMDIDLVMIFI